MELCYRVKIINKKMEYNFYITDDSLPREGTILDIVNIKNCFPKELYNKSFRVESVRKRLAIGSCIVKDGKVQGKAHCLETLVVAKPI